jgi:hypothetical protein
MKSASKAFGEGAANLGISSEPVTSYRIFEQSCSVMFNQESKTPMHPTEDNTKFRDEDNQPMRFANATLGKHRHVCAFFHGAEEEYRVLLPLR